MTAATDPGFTMTTAPVLAVTGVTKRFPGTVALDDVAFTVRPGEVHALVGENGAGKSTLIKVLTGVYQADEGEIRYLGEPVAFKRPSEAQRAGISTIYQEVNLVPLMSIAGNVFLGREPRTRAGLVDWSRMHAGARELLAGYGITDDVRRPLHALGVGAQQMVALARAVSTDAKVVVMDEPTSSLEPREVEKLFEVLARLHTQGIAVVYVSHRMDELYRVCDSVTVLRDGRVVHSGPLAALPRIELVSLMLGREIRQIREEGVTAFGEEHDVEREPLLRAENLSGMRRLHDVSVTIRPGEVVGLAGLLGSGRSETARAIVGAFPLDGGTVLVAGKPVKRGRIAAAMRAGIALLAEDRKTDGIIPNLSVRENIVLAALPGLSPFGLVRRSKQDRIVRTFMERLRIKASGPDQKVAELSGGNQQKVLLARWLATGPRVLLLDEPTRGIDVGAKAEVQALIDELAREGLGVLLISSELEELVDGADRVVVLRDGSVVGELAGDAITEENVLASIAEGGHDG
ncbi:sugar ABC transporter ATP-binding protein [Amycolatopsis acidiphila]|uniref:Sugar ABC transporter ATP-binding protein n=1 Tax=Amycolatopsis acidiphila TaxID=715473 RepID=A0A558AM02_9PSEU|nr:sugar ABC transporter ATP-binding protein [Amycolatopsis acidiphila]TVT25241.1 sugar ABC transporter ATP-binding protein [Amycolatopsis acidiphila]UIJ62357.1 sugar ABC transporter ATP-binding protein [Amycolatopsis acidiphila]GHG83232.1 sugar ABC transporter ATP-binding protein [Amycolatopsis acidiphila]